MDDKKRYEKMDAVDNAIYELVESIAVMAGVTGDTDEADSLWVMLYDIEVVADVRDRIIKHLHDKGLVGDYHDVYPCCGADNCPLCHAELELSDGLDGYYYVYCPACGTHDGLKDRAKGNVRVGYPPLYGTGAK